MKHSILAELPRYDRYLRGRGGLEIGYPWVSAGAIVALEHYIFQPGVLRREDEAIRDDRLPKRVLELGSGGSTVFFARRAPHVTSFETNPEWAEATRTALERHGLASKVDLRSVTHAQALLDVAALPDASYDLLLVDHDDPSLPRGKVVNRLELATVALSKLQPRGWLVVDNFRSNRMDQFDYSGWDVWRFDDMRWSGGGTLIARRA